MATVSPRTLRGIPQERQNKYLFFTASTKLERKK